MAKLARAVLAIATGNRRRADPSAAPIAIATAAQKVVDLEVQIDAYRDLSISLAFDELESAGSAK